MTITIPLWVFFPWLLIPANPLYIALSTLLVVLTIVDVFLWRWVLKDQKGRWWADMGM